ncbi:LOW QUALITY PROTEIN: hypothetical protein Cgig2_010304 [Carnegiea gigantea]|uniref:Uncharacterized protein n=1 Tax=Carnegiea gigantea TaxID=171969 RepID=A0A9Q1KHV5_9CARY|nr:LOW QUALITY PROTEIN: hypothetical protein Cgig2_010304 [Carnegiea gigantea]
MVDALKNFMSTMTDAITWQVFEQVKKVMEVANSARPLPHFDYLPVHEGKRSHRLARIPFPLYTGHGREVFRIDRSGRPYTKRILIDTGSSDCLKKLVHPGYDIIPLVRPILGFSGQEVNPTGMIRLPMHFGNKLRSKNAEVDFLLVDVPTTYNVILGRPTLHRGVGGFALYVLTLGGRRDKLHLLRVTALIGSLLMLIHIVEPRNSYPPETFGPASPGLGINTRGCWRGLATLLFGLGHLSSGLHPCLLYLALQPLLFGFISVQISPQLFPPPLVTSDKPLKLSDKPLKSSAFHRSPHPTDKTLGHDYFLLGDLKGIRTPGVTKSQDLTKSWTSESLAAASTLMKLMDGRWVIAEEPPADWGAAPIKGQLAPEWWGHDPQMTGFPIDKGPIVQFPPPHWQWGRGRGLVQMTLGPLPFLDRLMAGFFTRGMREGTGRKMTQSVESRDYEKGGKQGCTLYLFGLLGDEALPLFFLPTLGVGRHLLWGGVFSLEDRQPYPHLICIKRKGSQVSTKHKNG